MCSVFSIYTCDAHCYIYNITCYLTYRGEQWGSFSTQFRSCAEGGLAGFRGRRSWLTWHVFSTLSGGLDADLPTPSVGSR